MALGQVPDGGDAVVVDADRDELGEPGPRPVEHPERPVAGVDQVGGGLDDAAQHDREAELGPQRHDGVEEAT